MISERLADRLDVRKDIDQPINRPVDVGASGDNLVVRSVAGMHIRVLSYVLVAAAAVTVQWQSGITGDTATSFKRPLSGAMALAANSPLPSPSAGPNSWLFETDVNQDLILNLGGAQNVRGHLTYVLMPD